MKYPVLTGAGIFSSEILGLKPKSMSPGRRLKEFEIELFTENYYYGVIDGKRVPYSENTLLICKPGNIRCSMLDFRCRYIHFELEDEELQRVFGEFPTSIILSDPGRIIGLFNKIVGIYPSDPNEANLRLSAYILSLAADIRDELAQSESLSEVNRLGRETVNVAKAYMDKYFAQDISLSDIAEAVNLTTNLFCSVFSKACGQTPHDYLVRLRIARAKKMLVATTESVSFIAGECGFSSYSYFSTAFRSAVGLSPSEYRKKLGGEGYVL